MILSALASGVGSGLAGAAVSRLFGGKSKTPSAPDPIGINAGGLNAALSGGKFNVTSSADRLGLVGGIRGIYDTQADYFKNMASDFRPGFGVLSQQLLSANRGLTESALANLENRRRSAIGNLQENLQSRRILGSSFGMDALSRTEAEFERIKQDIQAEQASKEAELRYTSFLKEMDIFNNFNTSAFQSAAASFQTALQELNLQAELGAKLAMGANQTLSANYQFATELAAKNAASQGSFLGEVFGPFINQVGSSAGNWVGNIMNPATTAVTGDPYGLRAGTLYGG